MRVGDQLESDVQNDAYKYAITRGWMAEKIMRTRRNGFPDYFFLRSGRTVHIEFKRSASEAPSEQQLRRHKEIRDHGGEVHVVWNMAQVRKILR